MTTGGTNQSPFVMSLVVRGFFLQFFSFAQTALSNGRIARPLGEGTIPTCQVPQFIGVPLLHCHRSSPVINRNGCLSTFYQGGLRKPQIAIYLVCPGLAARISRARAAVAVGIVVVVGTRQRSIEPFLKSDDSIGLREVIHHRFPIIWQSREI
jgi:hypothetical protein